MSHCKASSGIARALQRQLTNRIRRYPVAGSRGGTKRVRIYSVHIAPAVTQVVGEIGTGRLAERLEQTPRTPPDPQQAIGSPMTTFQAPRESTTPGQAGPPEPHTPFDVEIQRDDDRAIVAPTGELDLATLLVNVHPDRLVGEAAEHARSLSSPAVGICSRIVTALFLAATALARARDAAGAMANHSAEWPTHADSELLRPPKRRRTRRSTAAQARRGGANRSAATAAGNASVWTGSSSRGRHCPARIRPTSRARLDREQSR
jgi:hypothetical protein